VREMVLWMLLAGSALQAPASALSLMQPAQARLRLAPPTMHLRDNVGRNKYAPADGRYGRYGGPYNRAPPPQQQKTDSNAPPSRATMSLPQKVDELAAELNLAEGLSIAETLKDAMQVIGLDEAQVGGLPLVAQADTCLQMLEAAGQMAETLRRELEIEGSMARVAEEACKILGIDTESKEGAVKGLLEQLEEAHVQTTARQGRPAQRFRMPPPPLGYGAPLEWWGRPSMFATGFYGGYYYPGYYYDVMNRAIEEEERFRPVPFSAAGRAWRRANYRA